MHLFSIDVVDFALVFLETNKSMFYSLFKYKFTLYLASSCVSHIDYLRHGTIYAEVFLGNLVIE